MKEDIILFFPIRVRYMRAFVYHLFNIHLKLDSKDTWTQKKQILVPTNSLLCKKL